MLLNSSVHRATKWFIVHLGFPIGAILIVLLSVGNWEPREHWTILTFYTIVTLVCTFAPIKTFNATLTINNAVIFSGILLYGKWIAVWSGMIEIILLGFLFKSSLTRTLANAGQMLGTIWLVGTAHSLLLDLQVPWILSDLLLIIIYLVANILLCGVIISYYGNISWTSAVNTIFKSGTVTYILIMIVASVAARMVDVYGISSLIPLAAIFLTINIVFHQYFDNLNKLEQKVDEINSLNHSFLTALAASIDARDPYTSGHSQRVAHWGREIANSIGLPKQQVDKVYFGGILHDVGKIGIEDDILNKEGRLSSDEFDRIKRHTVIGYEIVKQAGVFEDLLPAVRSHHERIDGLGYPDGLQGEEIPLIARILAIADAFDAMVSDRPYRRGMPAEKALQQIKAGAGTQFDKRLAQEFIQIIKQIPEDQFLQIIGKHGENRKRQQLKGAIR